ncbi:unnamed protein product, partial [Rotaria sp. Silwood2]
TSRNSLVRDACTHAGRYDELKSIFNLIEKIQKVSMNIYIQNVNYWIIKSKSYSRIFTKNV